VKSLAIDMRERTNGRQ